MGGTNIAAPLSATEFEQFVLSRPYFEANGLILAFDPQDGRLHGFVHCGFAPVDPINPCSPMDRSMGTIALICCESSEEIQRLLIEAGIEFLRSAGAKVIYAGGRFPLNPFYWGIYGGSEFSGILLSQASIHSVLVGSGYHKVAESQLFEYDLSKPEPRHVNNAILRRESRFHVLEDEPGECSWTSLALEAFHPLSLQITDRQEKQLIAKANLWPMSLYGRRDGTSRIGMIDVHVDEHYRRKGYGRLLLAECIKCVAELGYQVLCVQTDTSNLPATSLYERTGFKRTDSAVLYRHGGG